MPTTAIGALLGRVAEDNFARAEMRAEAGRRRGVSLGFGHGLPRRGGTDHPRAPAVAGRSRSVFSHWTALAMKMGKEMRNGQVLCSVFEADPDDPLGRARRAGRGVCGDWRAAQSRRRLDGQRVGDLHVASFTQRNNGCVLPIDDNGRLNPGNGVEPVRLRDVDGEQIGFRPHGRCQVVEHGEVEGFCSPVQSGGDACRRCPPLAGLSRKDSRARRAAPSPAAAAGSRWSVLAVRLQIVFREAQMEHSRRGCETKTCGAVSRA